MSDVVLGYTEELKKNRDKVTVRIRRRTRRTNILTPNTVVSFMPKCVACQDTGRAYWSDGVYGTCMECGSGVRGVME
jgi:hypothetical protein